MKPFVVVTARAPEEASGLLQEHGVRARLKAGGTDLLGLLKDELLPDQPEVLVSLAATPGLEAVQEEADGIVVGAQTRLSVLASAPLVRDRFPALAKAAQAVATPQIRNMGTLGGNLCQETRCWYYRYPKHVGGPLGCLRKGNGPCLALKGDNRFHAVIGAKKCYAACPSDTAVALAALDATVVVVGPHGRRTLPVDGLFTSLGTVLGQAEVVEAVRIPHPPSGARQEFVKFSVREPVDFAVASAACVVGLEQGVCSHVRICLGAVAPGPLRAAAAEKGLLGKPLDEPAAAAAAGTALSGAKPLGCNGYKVDVARALVRRALRGLATD